MKQTNNRNSGFTMIELMLSLALLFVTLVIFTAALGTLPLIKNTKNQNIAYHVAADKLEQFRNLDFAALPLSGGFADPALDQLESASADFAINDYEGSSQIKRVTVTVSWLEAQAAKNVVLETLISDTGLNP